VFSERLPAHQLYGIVSRYGASARNGPCDACFCCVNERPRPGTQTRQVVLFRGERAARDLRFELSWIGLSGYSNAAAMPARLVCASSIRSRGWLTEPLGRLAQLVFVVSGFYVGYALVLNLLDWFVLGNAGDQGSVFERIFNAASLGLESVPAIAHALALSLALLWSGVLTYYVVDRARQCVDYTTSLLAFHVIACWASFGLPAGLLWWCWVFMIGGGAGLVATILRQRKDLAPIAIVTAENGHNNMALP